MVVDMGWTWKLFRAWDTGLRVGSGISAKRSEGRIGGGQLRICPQRYREPGGTHPSPSRRLPARETTHDRFHYGGGPRNRLAYSAIRRWISYQDEYIPEVLRTRELESLIEDNLRVEAITLGLGICVIFRDPDQTELFQAARSRRRIDWSEIGTQLRFSAPAAREQSRANRYELHRELLDEFWAKLLELGRIPEAGEFDRLADVKKAAGGISRTFKLVLAHHGESMWQVARQSRAEDVLVYLAMTQFRKRFLRREIPLRIKHDIKAFFGDLPAAQSKARDLLFAAGDPDEVELAVEQLEFGVYDPDEKQLTFHRGLLPELPPILRIYVYCAALRYGNPEEADLIKIHVRSGKLTFLHYDDFDGKKHPVLETRIKINLRTRFVQVFDHRSEGQSLPEKRVYLSKARESTAPKDSLRIADTREPRT